MDRRTTLKWAAGAAGSIYVSSQAWPQILWATSPAKGEAGLLTRAVPKTGEAIPVIGMGTARTFNVGTSQALRDARTKVLAEFFALGGTLVDSSPMYGSSEAVVGHGLKKLGPKASMLSATKVWSDSVAEGKEQFQQVLEDWQTPRIDIYQIHNLRNWQGHLQVLREYKKQRRIRYLGVTTSHGRHLSALKTVMETTADLDFVQLTYNLEERWHEKEILDLALQRKIAVIVNRPFQRGDLFRRVQGKPLPAFAKEQGIHNWADYFLRWVVSHPAVTCAIPATTRVDHMRENMTALKGRFLDESMRQKMLDAYQRSRHS